MGGGPNEKLPGISQTEDYEGITEDCTTYPEFEDVQGLCGALMTAVYPEVTHSCDSVDLEGARWWEEVTTDDGCMAIGKPRETETFVVEGNKLARSDEVFRDWYFICRWTDVLPDNFHCTETYTQNIYLDDCHFMTKKIVFDIRWTVGPDGEGRCEGDVDWMDITGTEEDG